jgi:hypothetical protein
MANDALQTRGPMGLERPSFIKAGDQRGTENIGVGDIKPPALRIAQSNSPEAKRSEKDKYIAGLTEGMFFNSSTNEIYGEGPIQIIVINQLGHRNVQFDPKDKKVVLDFDVPDGDPRTAFTWEVKDGVKTRVKPAATCFYDYLIYVVHADGRLEMMTMSLKSTQLKKAKDFNGKILGSKMPAFAFLWSITPVPEHGKGNSWYGLKFEALGYVSEEQYNQASKQYDKFAGKKTEDLVQREGGDADGEGGPSGDDIPF